MPEYLGNVFALMERALADKKNGITLTADMMRQVLAEHAHLIEAKNELVRENTALRDRTNDNGKPTS